MRPVTAVLTVPMAASVSNKVGAAVLASIAVSIADLSSISILVCIAISVAGVGAVPVLLAIPMPVLPPLVIHHCASEVEFSGFTCGQVYLQGAVVSARRRQILGNLKGHLVVDMDHHAAPFVIDHIIEQKFYLHCVPQLLLYAVGHAVVSAFPS